MTAAPDLQLRADRPPASSSSGSGALGAFVYGFANRMLIPLGCTIPNSVRGSSTATTKPDGTVVTGELTGSPRATRTGGHLTSGFTPSLMLGLPAAALAMIHVADKKQRRSPWAFSPRPA